MDHDLNTWSVGRLRAELRAQGLPVDAVEKCDLVNRLLAVQKSSAPFKRKTDPDPHSNPATQPNLNRDEEVSRVLDCSPGNLYEILRVDRRADDDSLKKAYRNLALRLHPDKSRDPRAGEAFKRVSAAYAVLRDRFQRTSYDFSGGDNFSSNKSSSDASSSYSGGGNDPGSTFRDEDAEELYQAFFGKDKQARSAFDSTDLAVRFNDISGVVSRVLKVFYKNPWTLVTFLSGLASLISTIETLSKIVSVKAALPLLACAMFACFTFLRAQRR